MQATAASLSCARTQYACLPSGYCYCVLCLSRLVGWAAIFRPPPFVYSSAAPSERTTRSFPRSDSSSCAIRCHLVRGVLRSASCHVSIHPFLCGVADSGAGKSRLRWPILPELQRVEVGIYNISHSQGGNLGRMPSPLPHHVESSEANAGRPRLEYCFLQVVSELTASCELQAASCRMATSTVVGWRRHPCDGELLPPLASGMLPWVGILDLGCLPGLTAYATPHRLRPVCRYKGVPILPKLRYRVSPPSCDEGPDVVSMPTAAAAAPRLDST